MKKIFYLIKNSVTREQKWLPLTKHPYSQKFLFENSFYAYLRKQGILDKDIGKNYVLWSVPDNNKNKFETACKEIGIEFEELDLNKHYDDYKEQKNIFDSSTEDTITICSKDIDKIKSNPRPTELLLEHLVAKEDNIKLDIPSGENGKHKIPHCHVIFNHVTKYFSLSLVDYKVLTKDNKSNKDRKLNSDIVREAKNLLKEHIQKAREIWNTIDSPFKFEFSNGEYTDKFYIQH